MFSSLLKVKDFGKLCIWSRPSLPDRAPAPSLAARTHGGGPGSTKRSLSASVGHGPAHRLPLHGAHVLIWGVPPSSRKDSQQKHTSGSNDAHRRGRVTELWGTLLGQPSAALAGHHHHRRALEHAVPGSRLWVRARGHWHPEAPR